MQSNGNAEHSTDDLVLERLPNGEHAWLRAVAMQNPVPQSSVELSQTAKGATQVCVKVYAPQPAAAADMAQQLYDLLVARYAQP